MIDEFFQEIYSYEILVFSHPGNFSMSDASLTKLSYTNKVSLNIVSLIHQKVFRGVVRAYDSVRVVIQAI